MMEGTAKTINADNILPMAGVLSGAQMVVRALAEHGVKHIFGYPGGNILPLYEEMEASSFLRHTLVSHEQGAGHMADGYARASNRIAVVTTTSGPGAINLVTALATAHADSSPMVAITGQVPTYQIGKSAFQEANMTSITETITKANFLVTSIEELPSVLHQAFAVAQSGRPGPVLIDLPVDIQKMKGVYRSAGQEVCTGFPKDSDLGPSIAQAVGMMARADRPVFYIGGGVKIAGPQAVQDFRALAEATGFPVTWTLMGKGVYPSSGKQGLGMLGLHGTYESNMAMHETDLIIAIGARFDDRVTAKVSEFAPNAKIIHIDIDPSSINKIMPAALGIVADAGEAVAAMNAAWGRQASLAPPKDIALWRHKIAEWRAKDSLGYEPSATVIRPQYLLQTLNRLIRDQDAYVVTDVGQNQMWAAQYLDADDPRRFITSGGMGTMGFGLPAAIGVQTAFPEALVCCICGDGGFQMLPQEMMTATEEGLPVKVIMLNNHGLGMVRQVGDVVYKHRYSKSTNKAQPDFVMQAKAYGWSALSCARPDQVEESLRRMFDTKRPCLGVFEIHPSEDCWPMTRPGGGHHEALMLKPRAAATATL